MFRFIKDFAGNTITFVKKAIDMVQSVRKLNKFMAAHQEEIFAEQRSNKID